MRHWGLRFRRATREDRALAWVAASGLLSVAVLAPLLPGVARFAPACPLHAWTGLPCPGCGATRAALAFVHGDVLAALGWNPLAGAALALGGAAAALAPLWVALEWPVPALDAVLPARTRWALVALLVLNWAYLVVRRV